MLVVIAAATAVPATAIENGRPDRSQKQVGALGFDIDGPLGPVPPFGLCSGFVLSDRAFVTAAHCIAAVQGIAMSWAVTIEPGSPKNPAIAPGILDLVLFNLTDFPILAETVSTTTVHVHPDFNPTTLAKHVAVLEFPAKTFHVRPAKVSPPGLLDWLDRVGILSHLPAGIAGYGADQDLGSFSFSIPGYRNRGFMAFVALTDESVFLDPSEDFTSRTLPGDSGSPRFILGWAVSLTSMPDYQRLDIPAVREFLAPYAGRGFMRSHRLPGYSGVGRDAIFER
jgi:hypothetical protein